MPDTNPISNIRAADWSTGVNYKKNDTRYYQKSLIDTDNDINQMSEISPFNGWTSNTYEEDGTENHLPVILTPNIVRSGFGEEDPVQLPLQLEIASSPDAGYNAYTDSDGDFGELNTGTEDHKKIFLQIRNPNYPKYGHNFKKVSVRIIANPTKNFLIDNHTQDVGVLFTLHARKDLEEIKSRPSRFKFPLYFIAGNEANLKDKLSKTAKIVIKYEYENGTKATIEKDLSGLLTVPAKRDDGSSNSPLEFTIVAMSNELLSIQKLNGAPSETPGRANPIGPYYQLIDFIHNDPEGDNKKEPAYKHCQHPELAFVDSIDGPIAPLDRGPLFLEDLFVEGVNRLRESIYWPADIMTDGSHGVLWNIISEGFMVHSMGKKGGKFDLADHSKASKGSRGLNIDTFYDVNGGTAWNIPKTKNFVGSTPIHASNANYFGRTAETEGDNLAWGYANDRNKPQSNAVFTNVNYGASGVADTDDDANQLDPFPVWTQYLNAGDIASNNRNADKIFDKIDLNWNSEFWPSFMPLFTNSKGTARVGGKDVNGTVRDDLSTERRGWRNRFIVITNEESDIYQHSTSGRFTLDQDTHPSYSGPETEQTKFAPYKFFATGWVPDADASASLTQTWEHNDKVVGHHDGDARQWKRESHNFADFSEQPRALTSPPESLDGTFTEVTSRFPSEMVQMLPGTDNKVMLYAIPSGQAACEAKFGSSVIHNIYDLYTMQGPNFQTESAEDTQAGRENSPWQPWAIFPPYIRMNMPKDFYEATMEGVDQTPEAAVAEGVSPDILNGNFAFTDSDGTERTVYWETNFAQAYIPILDNKDTYAAGTADEAYPPILSDFLEWRGDSVGETPLDSDTPQFQVMAAHTDIGLLHVRVE